MNAEELKEHLRLAPLPLEGGYFAETYRSELSIPAPALPPRYASPRNCGTAIYYLLTPDTFSAMHRLQSDEIYHFYLGDPVELFLLGPQGNAEVITLGADLQSGMVVQRVVPHNQWQGSRLKPGVQAAFGYALLGTTMSPGFDPADFQLGRRADLIPQFPAFEEMICALTRG
jgi:hypothetical protein